MSMSPCTRSLLPYIRSQFDTCPCRRTPGTSQVDFPLKFDAISVFAAPRRGGGGAGGGGGGGGGGGEIYIM